MRRLIHFSVNLSDFVWRVSDVSDAILFCFFWRIKNWFRIEQFQEFFCGCCFLLFRQNVASLQMRRWKDNIRRNDLTVCVERETLSTERERETLSYSHEVAANLNLFSFDWWMNNQTGPPSSLLSRSCEWPDPLTIKSSFTSSSSSKLYSVI